MSFGQVMVGLSLTKDKEFIQKILTVNMYIGEAEGVIIEFRENYGSQENPINIEKLAVMHDNAPIVDFTLAILRKDGVLPFQWPTRREWCGNGSGFALVDRINIAEEYRASGIEPFMLNSLHNIIHHDCCIRIESLFIPTSVMLSTTRTKLRKQGFTRLGGSDCGYLRGTHRHRDCCGRTRLRRSGFLWLIPMSAGKYVTQAPRTRRLQIAGFT